MKALALALLLTCASVAAGQTSETGLIQGRVRDTEGRPLASVLLSAARADGSYRRLAESDSAGRFFLGLLPPGRYTLGARRVGLQPLSVTSVAVDAGAARSIDLVMTPAPTELAPVVVESGANVAIRKGDTESITRVAAEEIDRLPVGLEIDRVVAMTPGARPDALWGGASTQANSYQLDGLAFNHPGLGGRVLEPSLSWMEEIEVRGLGAGAQYGSFQGGLVNAVTKSGSNTHRWGARGYLESRPRSASNLGDSEIVPELASRRLLAAEASGPVMLDRLFFFASLEHMTTDRRALNHIGDLQPRFAPFDQTDEELRLLGKITWNASSRDLVNVMLGHVRNDASHFGLTGRELPEATLDRVAGATFGSLTWQHALGRDSYLDARAMILSSADTRSPAAEPNIPAVQTYELARFRHFQNALFRDELRPRTASASFSWRGGFSQGGWTEKLRAGFDLSSGSYREQRTRTGGMTWRPRWRSAFDPYDASTWVGSNVQLPSTWGGETRLLASVLNSAFWIEDEFSAGRVTMIRGVRFAMYDGAIARRGSGPLRPTWKTTAWDPRVGITVDLTREPTAEGTPRTVLKAHWGRFHQHLFAQMFDRAAGAEVYSDQEMWQYLGPAFSDSRTTFTVAERDALAASGRFALMERAELGQSGPLERVKQPYVDQTTLGIERAVGAKLRLEGLFVRRSNRDAIALVDRNRDRNYTRFDSVRVTDFLNRPILAPNGRPLVLQEVYLRNDDIIRVLRLNRSDLTVPGFAPRDTLRLSYDPDFVLRNAAELVREFRQVQFNVNADLGWLSGVASFAYTELWGNQAAVAGYDETSLYGRDDVSGRGPGALVRLNEWRNSHGKLENYTPYEVKVRVSGTLPMAITAGLLLQHRYGDRAAATFTLSRLGYNYYVVPSADTLHSLLLTGVTGERMYIDERGSRHYGDNTILDLKLERPMAVRGLQWLVSLEALNVLGDRAPLRVNTALEAQSDPNASTTFASVLERVPPRSFRLGVALRR